MPKRKTSNVTQLHDGRFRANKTFGYKPDGKPNRKYFYGKTVAEATQKLAAYERQVENGLNADVSGLTFGQWLEIWMREYKLNNIRPHTYDTYEGFIKNRIAPALGKHKLLKLRPEQLQSFINGLTKENGEKPSVSMIKQIKVIISSALTQAVRNGHITRNPADAIVVPKSSELGEKKKVHAFTKQEQAALLKQFREHRLYALIVLAIGSGMRIGEILALVWGSVDFENNEISVSASVSQGKERETTTGQALGGRTRRINQPKTDAGNRRVPLTAEVREALLHHRQQQEHERAKAFSAWKDKDLVFCTQLGDYLTYRNVVRLYKTYRDKALLPDYSFHSLRHAFVTNAISAGVDYYYLSRIIGHESIMLTLDTYADFMPDKSRQEMSKLEGVLQLRGL